MGAWIETEWYKNGGIGVLVAPYMGAWIETSSCLTYESCVSVAPYMGAWIETYKTLSVTFSSASHPIWVRGLKPTRTRVSVRN